MGRVDEAGLGAGLDRALGFQGSDSVALTGDAGDDRDLAVDGVLELADDECLLVLGQEGAFAGVAQDHEALDALDAGQPAAQAVDRVDVDAAVAVERGYRCGDKPAEIDGH